MPARQERSSEWRTLDADGPAQLPADRTSEQDEAYNPNPPPDPTTWRLRNEWPPRSFRRSRMRGEE
jgi:hypothetical protein